MGSFLAASTQQFSWAIFALACLTTIFLQILSNLANDYGDSVHGADSKHREGPSRAVQAGYISAKSMKNAMYLFAALSFISGVLLLYVSLGASWRVFFTFLGLGILCIIAAIAYTNGSSPYGYAGLGDISVMIFFGFVGVMGTYYLHTHSIYPLLALPAASCGFFATAVLNINNIRDISSDVMAGKRSIPVRLGPAKSRVYHWFLLIGGLACAAIYVWQTATSVYAWLFLLALPPLLINGLNVQRKSRPSDIDPYLKQMALTTLLFVLTFGIGQLLR
jgi:1,4-dihydroxy-2-naphthoate octaprenyltransferase